MALVAAMREEHSDRIMEDDGGAGLALLALLTEASGRISRISGAWAVVGLRSMEKGAPSRILSLLPRALRAWTWRSVLRPSYLAVTCWTPGVAWESEENDAEWRSVHIGCFSRLFCPAQFAPGLWTLFQRTHRTLYAFRRVLRPFFQTPSTWTLSRTGACGGTLPSVWPSGVGVSAQAQAH